MKKAVLIIFLGVNSMCNLFAQSADKRTSDNYINIAIGANSFYGFGFPLCITYEKEFINNISAGICLDYLSGRKSIYAFTPKFRVLYPGIRISYHLNSLLNVPEKKFDLYAGGLTGHRDFKWKKTYGENVSALNYRSGFFVGGYIGLRYYISKHFGFSVEAGSIGSSNAKAGISLKI